MSDINEMNKEQVTVEDILAACCGTDGADNTKVGFSLDFGIFNPTTNEFDIKNSITFCNPVLNITRVGETAMIDFIFESKTDSELRRMWALMQKHGKEVEEAFRAGAKNIPFMRAQIVPIAFSGRYTVTAYGPLYWVLQPEYPTGEINMLRTVFNTESVLFSENEAYDEGAMAAQLQREDAERDRMEMLAEQKKMEEAEYRAERQRNLEELRRTRQDY